MRHHSGLTLIEMIVASSVMAVLAMSIFFVMTHLMRAEKATITQHRPSLEPLRQILTQDLRVASKIEAGGDGHHLRLIGHGAIDPSAKSRTGHQVVVDYTVEQAGSIRVFVRRQMETESRSALTWADIVDFEVERIEILKGAASSALHPSDQLVASPVMSITMADGRRMTIPLMEGSR